MSNDPTSESPSQTDPSQAEERNPLEKRDQRRESRTKNTLIWRELAIIAALGVVILAFNLNWGNPENNKSMAAKSHDEIRLRDVRPTPPEPEPPEPEPEPQSQPEPKPQVQKNQQRQEVPDEQVQEQPEPAEKTVAIDNLEKTVTETASSEPAPQSNPAPNPQPSPKPPKNKVFDQGTVDKNAQMKGAIEVKYPSEARRAGVQGQVILQFVVDESGRPQSIEVLRSPHDALSEAAVAALKRKSFTPARQNGKPVKMRMSQPVTFRLQN